MDLSRSPTIIKTKGLEIILNNEEKHAYRQFFQAADEDENGVITGQNAVRFFGKSGLTPEVLSKIWQIADSENKGFLTKQTFIIAIKLIARVQNGQSLDPTKVNDDVPIPRFEGIDVELYVEITDEDREKYKDMFYTLNPVNGILDGKKASDFFLESKLPTEKLGQIWKLADTRMRGQLDLQEFIIAMHFIQQTRKGITKLPAKLPSGLYEKLSGSVSYSTSPPPFVRNLSSPRPGSGQSPVMRHMTLDSGPTTPSIFQDNSWDVNEKDKASYDRFFDSIEENKCGYVTGEIAVNFFKKSKLSVEQLAQIWDLADIDKSGRLNRDKFAVAMYLITKKLSGVPIPTTLPNSLIPPSIRSVTASPSPFTDLKRSTTMSNRLHTPQLSESDLFFDSVAASSSPFFSSTAPQSGGDFDLLGDTDMSTKIALESGEIKNYKLQTETLNNVTADLKTNRANVESNISSLVTQKQDMMTQLSQIRTLYESEAKAMREVQAKYDLEHESVERVRQELLQAEKAFRALQLERDQLQANIQKDRDETLDTKRRMRIIEEETVSIKAGIEKLKKDGKQQKGILAIGKKQLVAVEGEREKAFKTLQNFENNLPSEEISDPFGNGAFTPSAFNPSNTTQGPGITAYQPVADFSESSNFQKSSNHSHRGSLSSVGGSVKRSMSNASIASNSTIGTSSIKSAPLNTTNKSDELTFDKPITVASSKPSEFENISGDKLSSTPQEITANTESGKTNPFDSTFNDPFGGASDYQTDKSTQNIEESTIQDTAKESEKTEADPLANLDNIPTSEKSISNNDDLSSESFSKEFPSIEEIEADFTSLTTNNEKKDDNLMENSILIQNEKSEKAETVTVNNIEVNDNNKDAPNKESELPFSIVADSAESTETSFPPLQDPDAWVSIESSKSIAPQDEFEFGDLTQAKVAKNLPIEFDAGFDDADLDFGDVNLTFDNPANSSSTNNNNTITSSKTDDFVKSSLGFDKNEKLFDEFDPFSSSNKPKANLDVAFGGVSADPLKTNSDVGSFGFEDAFIDKKSSSAAKSIVGDDVADVKRLMEMGYPREKVVHALEINNYDFEKSVNYLADNS